ncbi:hypothetical protein QEJ31_11600 [Pigmentibacter sp. JX0631]|uniref:hypothetical protein n=1 Tax=Pigmentibacter sp. JX0631 TaxID=2976982 RepID=UPI002468873A|nr:hypothetical protein [Pigmentibacter sp. JX0631]WGL59166.1 hypothetical protein QEJ31_11600 [Pigmentibacter sp. JX0631]
MIKNLLKNIVTEIEKNFPQFEEYLLSPSHIKEFKKFLSNYRGMNDQKFERTYELQRMSEKTAENLVNFFTNIFSTQGLAEENEKDIFFILNEVEKIVNLSLFYWFGLNDRNYQFRAVVHFYDIDGLGSVFLTKNNTNFAVSLSEDGIRFGLDSSNHEPKCLPVSKVCELNSFNIRTDERKLFARIRTIQREICLLVDEWEHLNSILAVEYGQIYYNLQQNQNKKNVEAFETITQKMNSRRDSLAFWCLESFCDFQEWISDILVENRVENLLSDDILSELDATVGVLLSGFQKIFLPASVSRHKYTEEILDLLLKFSNSRLKLNSDDFSSFVLKQCTLCAQGKNIDPELLSFVSKKPFEWKFSFDPSSAIKAFSWKYSKDIHIIITLVYGICLFKKISPNLIDYNFLSDVATTFQMPETFPEDQNQREIFTDNAFLTEENYYNLVATMNKFLDNNIKKNKNNDELVAYIRNLINQKRQTI